MSSSSSSGPLPVRVVEALRCSVCASPVELAGRTLRCERGHAFDLAKHGYVNLLHAKIPAGTADTAEMVAARADFLAAGHYAGIADRLAGFAADVDGLVIDAGAGTGYYLARVLGAAPLATGLALDVSALALRRAARAHERIGAAVWNLWEPWPVASSSASLVLNVFAPRNGAEFHRVLEPGGRLVVVSPCADHLRELASVVHLLDVDRRKEERIDRAFAGLFELASREHVVARRVLSPLDVRRAVLMGPNAFHPERVRRLDEVVASVEVTASVLVSEYRRV